MRIATMVIALALSAFALLESFAVKVEGALVNVVEAKHAASVGIGVAFGLLVGGAFAFGLPAVALVVFALSGAYALSVAGRLYPIFPDLLVFGWACVALALMAALAWREKWKAARKQRS
jgi:hypothetical protein